MGLFKREKRTVQQNKETAQWDSVFFFIPLFQQPVQMPSEEELKKALSAKMGHVEESTRPVPQPMKDKGVQVWELWDLMAYNEADQRKYPVQLALSAPGGFNRKQWDEHMIRQFWCCGAQREQFVERCRYSVVCNIFLTGQIARQHYGKLIADYADAVLALFSDCIGFYWPSSQSLVSREYFEGQHWSDVRHHFLDGGLNVRVFRTMGRPELLIDTLGLTTIGLPDLQMYCRDLDVQEAVLFLRNFAAGLYDHGDVIEEGDTIEGREQEKWVCNRMTAMAAPARPVIDIIPGRYAGEKPV